MRIGRLLCALALLATFHADAIDDKNWTTDFEAAKASAAKDGKDVLMLFTGSDWCPWCIKEATDVLDKDEAMVAAKKNFVLFVADFPKTPLPEATAAQNKGLMAKYAVIGYPTIVFVDGTGKVFAQQVGYFQGTVEQFKDMLSIVVVGRKQRDTLLLAASKASGIEKAKIENEAMTILARQAVFVSSFNGYDDVIKDIMDTDKDNKAGLKMMWDYIGRVNKAHLAFNAEDYKQVLALMDDFLKEYPDERGENPPGGPRIAPLPPNAGARQRAYYLKAATYDCMQDRVNEVEMLKKVIAMDPDDDIGKESASIMEQLAGEEKK